MGDAAEELSIAEPQELFDLSMLPCRDDLVKMVKERSFLPSEAEKKRFRHTGKILIKKMLNDVELCESICAAILTKASARLIGLRFQISPHSVVVIRQAMEERGELAAVRTRLTRLVDEVTELGLETVRDGLLAGQIPAGSAWIPALATLDKREQLSVGLVPGADRTRASVTVEQVLAEHALARAALTPSDSQSPALPAQVTDTQAPVSPQTGPATGPATAPVTLDLPKPLEPALPVAAARTGAGGVASAPARTAPQGNTPENFTP